jgi:hypothetical protein
MQPGLPVNRSGKAATKEIDLLARYGTMKPIDRTIFDPISGFNGCP